MHGGWGSGFCCVLLACSPGLRGSASPMPVNRPREMFRARTNAFLSTTVHDLLSVNYHLFSRTTMKVATLTIPTYLITRKREDLVQRHFYDACHHKNTHCMPHGIERVASFGVGIAAAGLYGLSWIVDDEELCVTSRVFGAGALSLVFLKNAFKHLHVDANLRPWHEKFSCKKRSYGGLPSGHMAHGVYMTLLYGMRFGPAWAIPLSLLTTFYFAAAVSGNRHYLSQIVAGAGFGVAYALSTNHVVSKRVGERVSFDVGPGRNGGMRFGVCWQY